MPRLRRLVHGLPVLVPLVLFAQISIGGLRPALIERWKLAEERSRLEERRAQDGVLLAELDRRFRARQDPVFLERQRRELVSAPWSPR